MYVLYMHVHDISFSQCTGHVPPNASLSCAGVTRSADATPKKHIDDDPPQKNMVARVYRVYIYIHLHVHVHVHGTSFLLPNWVLPHPTYRLMLYFLIPFTPGHSSLPPSLPDLHVLPFSYGTPTQNTHTHTYRKGGSAPISPFSGNTEYTQ